MKVQKLGDLKFLSQGDSKRAGRTDSGNKVSNIQQMIILILIVTLEANILSEDLL